MDFNSLNSVKSKRGGGEGYDEWYDSLFDTASNHHHHVLLYPTTTTTTTREDPSSNVTFEEITPKANPEKNPSIPEETIICSWDTILNVMDSLGITEKDLSDFESNASATTIPTTLDQELLDRNQPIEELASNSSNLLESSNPPTTATTTTTKASNKSHHKSKASTSATSRKRKSPSLVSKKDTPKSSTTTTTTTTTTTSTTPEGGSTFPKSAITEVATSTNNNSVLNEADTSILGRLHQVIEGNQQQQSLRKYFTITNKKVDEIQVTPSPTMRGSPPSSSSSTEAPSVTESTSFDFPLPFTEPGMLTSPPPPSIEISSNQAATSTPPMKQFVGMGMNGIQSTISSHEVSNLPIMKRGRGRPKGTTNVYLARRKAELEAERNNPAMVTPSPPLPPPPPRILTNTMPTPPPTPATTTTTTVEERDKNGSSYQLRTTPTKPYYPHQHHQKPSVNNVS